VKLTERESVVFDLIAKGLTDREIADRLCVSIWTARKHRENLLEKFHFCKSTQLVIEYFSFHPDALKKTTRRATRIPARPVSWKY
jgi:DNA-binding NarL/FixJ family response regulator